MHIHHYLIQLGTDCQHTDPTKACQSVSIGTLPEPVSQSVSIKVYYEIQSSEHYVSKLNS